MKNREIITFIFALIIINSFQCFAQFTNRYPKLDGFRQQIYIEGYDLPISSTKPIYYSPSLIKNRYAYCQNGKVYISKENGEIFQIPNNGFIDFQPKWNNDGSKIVFTRDNGYETFIMLFDLNVQKEEIVHRSGKIDLDPSFTYDGLNIIFSSSALGSLDIFIKSIKENKIKRLTDLPTCELSPVQLNNDSILFLSKTQFGDDKIILYSIKSGKSAILKELKFMGVSKLATAEGKYLIYSWHEDNTYSLKLISILNPEFEVTIAKNSEKNFLYPIYSQKDTSIYFNEFSSTDIKINKAILWSTDYKTVKVNPIKKNFITFKIKFTPYKNINKRSHFRLSIKDEKNNCYFPKEVTNIWFDPSLGNQYCYVSDSFLIDLPQNAKLSFTYSNGLEFFSKNIDLSKENNKKTLLLDYQFKWNNTFLDKKFYSGDNHFHLNTAGPYFINLNNIQAIAEAENLQFISPLIANVGNRIIDVSFYGHKSKNLVFGQEVRSHFHGHLSLIGGKKLFYPQFWGPFYEVFNDLDISNSTPINFGYNNKMISTYVHPTFTSNPFDPENISKNTYDIIQNSINNKHVGIELVNIWSDEIGTQEIYETILNVGANMFLNAGTDAFPNFFRTPPVGSTRIYTYSNKINFTYQDFIDAIKDGRSFTTNGPILLFSINDSLPGSNIPFSDSLRFSASVFSYSDSLTFEIISNSTPVFQQLITSSSDFLNLSGTIKCPQGGWISARLISKVKPKLYSDSYSYAYTSPIWIDKKNKIPKQVASEASKKLIYALEKNRITVKNAYNDKALNQLNEIDKSIIYLKKLVE